MAATSLATELYYSRLKALDMTPSKAEFHDEMEKNAQAQRHGLQLQQLLASWRF